MIFTQLNNQEHAMIAADAFCAELDTRAYTLAIGVPCSCFGGPIALLSRTKGRYVPAANEGTALAIAAGVALAGGRPYMMLQNSGLGNLINPLTSLVLTYRIPILVFASLRGWPDPSTDEPQHAVMGPATPGLLAALGIPYQILRASDNTPRFREILDIAEKDLDAGQVSFILIERQAIGTCQNCGATDIEGASSVEVIRLIADIAPDAAVVATTGYTSRELFAVADRPGNFYMQGSMGHASSIGLGIALTKPHRQVIVLDGDGALLMHLGSLSTIGDQAPPNLLHVVLDNQAHESTGGQRTTSATTSFSQAALAAGYLTGTDCRTLEEVSDAVSAALAAPGPHLCVVRTLPRTGSIPPRATSAITPQRLRDRFAQNMRAR
jgi:phosphonopyruvate decarboxylase